MRLLDIHQLAYRKHKQFDALLLRLIQDLGIAGEFMQILYENKVYRAHLEGLINKQVIMLGFSDGTKDAGYLTAN